MIVELDSLQMVFAINGKNENMLEVGHVIDQCKILLRSLLEVSVTHIRKQAVRSGQVIWG